MLYSPYQSISTLMIFSSTASCPSNPRLLLYLFYFKRTRLLRGKSSPTPMAPCPSDPHLLLCAHVPKRCGLLHLPDLLGRNPGRRRRVGRGLALSLRLRCLTKQSTGCSIPPPPKKKIQPGSCQRSKNRSRFSLGKQFAAEHGAQTATASQLPHMILS
jgi:hypothetical protein